MNWLSLHEIAEMVDGQVHGDNVTVDAVSIDSRAIEVGELFVAIKGDHYDGHQFIAMAQSAGAVAIMARENVSSSLPWVEVSDTTVALAQLAQRWRQKLQTLVIGLTGSNGKTTTKTMLASILGMCRKAVATKGNLNNHIGVPLTLLSLRKDHQCAVVEMGANHPQEIGSLCHIARPDVGMVLNAGTAHIEGFGNLDGVAAAKGEMYECLSQDATAIFNCDDAYYEYWSRLFKGQSILRFGFSNDADISASMLENGEIELCILEEKRRCKLQLAGDHNVMNALAAAAAAYAVGIGIDNVASGLEQVRSLSGRLMDVNGIKGMSIIDDTYNANPTSLRAALCVLQKRRGRRWLALGDMAELGPSSKVLHIAAACDAKAAGVECLMTVGEYAQTASEEFGKGGTHFSSIEEMVSYLKNEAAEDVCLLVKGSRSSRMERLVDALME